MHLGNVLGTLVATKKYASLQNWSFRVVQPVDHQGRYVGEPIVAVDTVGSREGDQVMWVTSREAAIALDHEWFNPVDATIVGIVDNMAEPEENL
jgi:microcompartment protein CcmK/EutM